MSARGLVASIRTAGTRVHVRRPGACSSAARTVAARVGKLARRQGPDRLPARLDTARPWRVSVWTSRFHTRGAGATRGTARVYGGAPGRGRRRYRPAARCRRAGCQSSPPDGDQGALTFTASTWDTAQTVTLTGQDDSDTDGNQNYTVTLVVNQTSTADANYDALGTVTVYAFNADDEVTADVNEDGTVDRDDALVMYYVYTFGAVLKDAERASLRSAALRPRRGSLEENDASYLQMITNAERLAGITP